MIKTKKFSKWVDDQVPMNKIIGGVVGQAAEAADGFVFGKMFEAAAKKVPEEHHEVVQGFLDAVVDGKYDLIKDISCDYIVGLIKTPFGDEVEDIWVGGILDCIFKTIELKANKEVLSAAPSTVGGGGPGGHPEGKGG